MLRRHEVNRKLTLSSIELQYNADQLWQSHRIAGPAKRNLSIIFVIAAPKKKKIGGWKLTWMENKLVKITSAHVHRCCCTLGCWGEDDD